MKAAHSLFLMAALLGCQFAAADTKEITLGSDAPAMQVKSWYKGTPVSSFDKNKLYVVEFWATWCGPCRESIPHLTEMAKKNKDVTFVGVSIWEEDKGGNVKKFIDEMGPKMDYNVGYSGNKEGMAETWMSAAGQNGIPTAFVVKGGKIEWIGHPMELEKPLGEIKAGTYSMTAAKAALDKQQEEGRAMRVAGELVKKARTLYKDGKKKEANDALDEAIKKSSQMAMNAKMIRLGWQAKDDVPAFKKQVAEMSASKNPQDVMMLGAFALEQVQPGGDKALGKEVIDTTLKATNESDFVTLYYGSMFYRESKDNATALRLLTKARDLLPKTPYNSPQFKDSLDKEIKALTTPK